MLQIFNYENSPIQFEVIEGRVMANATLMAKAFNKEPIGIFKTQSWIDFVKVVCEDTNLKSEDIQTSKMGSPENGGGTWIHEELVIEFSRRLNTKFSLWCNRKVSELLRTGSVSLQPTELTRMDLIQLAMDSERERLKLEQQVVLLSPKAEYTDLVLLSKSTFTTTDIADELGMSAIKLNRLLCYKGIQRRESGRYILYAKYQGKEYTTTRTHTHTGADGSVNTTHLMVWTEKGRVLIHNAANENLSWSQPGKQRAIA